MLCLIVMHHSMMLHLCLQCCCLLIDENGKRLLLMDAFCVLFLLPLHSRLSFVSAEFDFNASLNDVAPVPSMLFTVYLRMEKGVDCLWISFVCCFFCTHHPE